jgi:hypothetical protein
MKEYRVVTQSDTFWGDRFDASALEAGLNRLARSGWRVIAVTSSEHWSLGGLAGKRGETCVILERDVVPATTLAEALPAIEGDGYDATKIPTPRYYKDVGNVSTLLREAGLVDKSGLDRARERFARHGGHLVDHVLALGLVDDERMRAFFRERFGINC